ncbi:MAG TPA: Fur family transcriptional regulator [Chroococcales cyanobacterium]
MKSEIEELLLKHGVKPTPQRAVITEFLVGTHSHPTAEDVFNSVANSLPVPLSRATVYNTLNCLVDAGVIQEVFTEPGRARYDANISEHHHFVDVKTGQVLDIEPEQISSLKLNLGNDLQVHHYHVTIFGEVKKSAEP